MEERRRRRRRRRASCGDSVPIKVHPRPLFIFFAGLHDLLSLMMYEVAGEEEEEEEDWEETPASTEQNGRLRPTPLQAEDVIMPVAP